MAEDDAQLAQMQQAARDQAMALLESLPAAALLTLQAAEARAGLGNS